MMLSLSLEYGSLVFLAATGVLQLAALHGHLNKLLFFPGKVYSYILSLVLVFPAAVLLFTWNYHYPTGIIQGAEQAGLFVLCLALAVVFTLIFSSLLNTPPAESQEKLNPEGPQKEGLEALKEETYWQALKRFLRRKP